ncbi:MAG: ABC transporter ATP-binding protein [Acidobacteriota bacterium]|jgi:lipoprotein-releasing system ATP-binding protein
MSDFLRVEGLFKSFRSGESSLEVIRDLSLDLPQGEMLAVTGESGSGKSTFLHLVGAMEKPDSGTILFEGQDLGRLTDPELAEFRNESIGFVFQFHHLLPEFTALENVMFPLLLRRVSFREASATAASLLAEMGLRDRMEHQPGELSGGEQQRVAIARALAGRPKLLLADEPTGNLDERTSESIHEVLVRIHEIYQLTSIIVTHNPSLAEMCGVCTRMENGRLFRLDLKTGRRVPELAE